MIARPGKNAIQGAVTSTGSRVEDHAAPGGRRRLDAEAEKGEPGLEQDDVAHAQRRRHEQRARARWAAGAGR